jgi:hypothetical protein
MVTMAVDWNDNNWGGHVHVSSTGSHLDAEPTEAVTQDA